MTRDEPPDGPLSTALRAAGLDVIHEPVLERSVLSNAYDEIAALTSNDWLVLTSVFAIEAVAGDVARVPHVAVVGNSSRRTAEARGFRVALVASSGDAMRLFHELFIRAHRARICYPRSSQAMVPDVPPGVDFVSPVLYETVAMPFRKSVLEEADLVAVTSSSAVRAVGPVDLPFASIGPSTSAALREIGVRPWVEAPQRSFESLARTIAAQANASRHHRA
ncbi:MAG: uroporphyrinogen-III synthase [Planctomycetes bacterium]|nr:uroporphyrinogen-III synthase [Planctomycetota bacterium]